MKNCTLSVLVAVAVVVILIAIWISWNGGNPPRWMQMLWVKRWGEKFSTFSGPSNPIINVYAARPEFDPRFNMLRPYTNHYGDYSQKALRAEAARRGMGPYPGASIDEGGPGSCGNLVSKPAPCRATERMAGAPGVDSECARLCPMPLYARASGGETGSPWLGRAPARETFKPSRAPSVPRADGGKRHSPVQNHPPGAYAAQADLSALDHPNRAPAFTQLMRGSLARQQQHSAPADPLTGVGQGIRGDPRYDPPAHSTRPPFTDNRPAHGSHAGGPVYSQGLATARFRW